MTCRCCHRKVAKNSCKDLFIKNQLLDKNKEELYSVMIQECFGLTLNPTNNNKICNYCIRNLRNAVNFKEKIIKTEKLLLSASEGNTQTGVKKELALETDDDDLFLDDSFLEIELKETNKVKEDVKVVPKTERKVKFETPTNDEIKMAKKPKTDSGINHTRGRSRQIKILRKPRSKVKSVEFSHKEKYKHEQNLNTILNFSNVVPFKNKTVYGYVCHYCNEPFPDPADLRRHTEQKHTKDRLDLNKSFAKRLSIDSLIIKLDITNLRCTICDESMSNLETLKDHLVNFHDKAFHKLNEQIVQFRLKAGQQYDCALCESTYETYKMLLQHMNTHCRNYVCDECGTPFVTKARLKVHETTHMNGSFKCDFCDKVFPSRIKKYGHEKTTHKSKVVMRCPHCEESFTNYYQRNQHMVRVHDEEMLYKCNICNKRFLVKRILMTHIRKHHLLERNFQCAECPLSFFTKNELDIHMVKHTGEKIHECKVCGKSYGRQKTLRDHMKVHNADSAKGLRRASDAFCEEMQYKEPPAYKS